MCQTQNVSTMGRGGKFFLKPFRDIGSKSAQAKIVILKILTEILSNQSRNYSRALRYFPGSSNTIIYSQSNHKEKKFILNFSEIFMGRLMPQ